MVFDESLTNVNYKQAINYLFSLILEGLLLDL